MRSIDLSTSNTYKWITSNHLRSIDLSKSNTYKWITSNNLRSIDLSKSNISNIAPIYLFLHVCFFKISVIYHCSIILDFQYLFQNSLHIHTSGNTFCLNHTLSFVTNLAQIKILFMHCEYTSADILTTHIHPSTASISSTKLILKKKYQNTTKQQCKHSYTNNKNISIAYQSSFFFSACLSAILFHIFFFLAFLFFIIAFSFLTASRITFSPPANLNSFTSISFFS